MNEEFSEAAFEEKFTKRSPRQESGVADEWYYWSTSALNM